LLKPFKKHVKHVVINILTSYRYKYTNPKPSSLGQDDGKPS
jgi:hypothetical protein